VFVLGKVYMRVVDTLEKTSWIFICFGFEGNFMDVGCCL